MQDSTKKRVKNYQKAIKERKTKRRLFRGADKPGWYWIQDKKLGRALPLDKELFEDLLTEVQPL